MAYSKAKLKSSGDKASPYFITFRNKNMDINNNLHKHISLAMKFEKFKDTKY
jgi:hypothetical protein